eukprot:4923055-Pleurochrysis_carterae.AAC.1
MHEPGRVANAEPVAANSGGGGIRRSRPPVVKYAWTRQRPHAQGRRSGDEVIAMARAPIRSMLWCVSMRVRCSSCRYGVWCSRRWSSGPACALEQPRRTAPEEAGA